MCVCLLLHCSSDKTGFLQVAYDVIQNVDDANQTFVNIWLLVVSNIIVDKLYFLVHVLSLNNSISTYS